MTADASNQRWFVLLAFCYNTACNAFMFMNFAPVEDVSRNALGDVSVSSLNWLYSASLLSVLPFAFPVSYLLNHRNMTVTGMGVVCNVAGAWLRYISVSNSSYWLALLSSIFVGISASVIITAVAHLPDTWFSSNKLLATCVAVQANYAGWCMGSVVVPYVVDTAHDLEVLLFYQAFVVSMSLLLFLAFHRASPTGVQPTCPAIQESNAPTNFESSFFQEFRMVVSELSKDRSYMLQLFAYSALGGISFAIPAVQGEVISDEVDGSDSGIKTAWTNFAFICSGVIGGLYFGTVPQKHVDKLIGGCFFFCSLSLTLLIMVSAMKKHDLISFELFYVLAIVLMATSGMASLGFIGPALNKVCQAAPHLSHSWTGGGVEWWIQVWGSLLTQVSIGSVGFIACAASSWVAMTVYFISEHQSDGTVKDVPKFQDLEEEE